MTPVVTDAKAAAGMIARSSKRRRTNRIDGIGPSLGTGVDRAHVSHETTEQNGEIGDDRPKVKEVAGD
jgi:hypothetical protein